MKIFRHLIIIAAGLFALLAVPFMRTDYYAAMISGTDTVSGASILIDKPSGEYIVLLNRDLHTDKNNLNEWKKFFRGEEISFIFEDISCLVPEGDASGLELARSYQSQLPENQMKVRTCDATLLCSKADNDRFDIIIMSKEFYDSFRASTALDEGVEMIEYKDGVQ